MKRVILSVLLDPTEEQLNGPSPTIESGDFFGTGIKIVGQDAQHLSGLCGDADLANGLAHWIATAPGLAWRQKADAVPKDVAAANNRQLLRHLERRVGFEARDEPATGSVKLGPQA